MWDTVQTSDTHLSHDMPCQRCGHALHTFLGCDDGCELPARADAGRVAPRLLV